MTIFIVALSYGKQADSLPAHARHTLARAKQYGGTPHVIALSTYRDAGADWIDATPYIPNTYVEKLCTWFEKTPDTLHIMSNSNVRWCVIAEYLKQHPEREYPIINLDWDLLLLAPLVPHLQALRCIPAPRHTVGISYNPDPLVGHSPYSAPYYVSSQGLVEAYVQMLHSFVAHQLPIVQHLCSGDMALWNHFYRITVPAKVNLTRIVEDAFFDINMALSMDGLFKMRSDGLRYIERAADGSDAYYFVEEATGRRIRAISAHCTSLWRPYTHQLMLDYDHTLPDSYVA